MYRLQITWKTLICSAAFLIGMAALAAPGDSPPDELEKPTEAPATTQWNQWRGANRDGTAPGQALPSSLRDDLKLAWEKPLGSSYSGPVVSGGLVYTTETIDRKSEVVTAYKIDDGQQVWRTEWPGAMAVFPIAAANGDWIRATPACNGDALVVLGMRDVLVCLDAKTGTERWRIDFPKELGTSIPKFGAVCSPLIDNDAVYVQTGGPTVKISIDDGSVIWKTLDAGDNIMSAGAFSSPTVATIDGTRQLVVQTRTELCGVDLESGEPLWRQPVEAFRGMNILTPTVVKDQLFTATYGGRSQMWQVNRSDSGQWTVEEKWNQKTQGYMSSPIVVDDQIYLHAKNERLIALDVNDGSIRWTSKPMGKYWSMLHDGERILALGNTGDLRLIDHDTAELKITDQSKVGEDSWAYLAISGNKIIVRDLKALKVFTFQSEETPPNRR